MRAAGAQLARYPRTVRWKSLGYIDPQKSPPVSVHLCWDGFSTRPHWDGFLTRPPFYLPQRHDSQQHWSYSLLPQPTQTRSPYPTHPPAVAARHCSESPSPPISNSLQSAVPCPALPPNTTPVSLTNSTRYSSPHRPRFAPKTCS